MNPHLEMLLSNVYPGSLAKVHRDDLKKYPISDATIAQQKIRSVPPNMIQHLLGFDPPGVVSAMLIPFADPAGGWMDFPRVKVFPTLERIRGKGKKRETIKYLQPKASGARLFFPLATMETVCTSLAPLYVYEGEKKAILMAQYYGYPTIGLCGVECWHTTGSDELLPDFDCIRLRGRVVKVIPDGDVETNRNVSRAVWRFGAALARRGAKPELVHLPTDLEIVA